MQDPKTLQSLLDSTLQPRLNVTSQALGNSASAGGKGRFNPEAQFSVTTNELLY